MSTDTIVLGIPTCIQLEFLLCGEQALPKMYFTASTTRLPMQDCWSSPLGLTRVFQPSETISLSLSHSFLLPPVLLETPFQSSPAWPRKREAVCMLTGCETKMWAGERVLRDNFLAATQLLFRASKALLLHPKWRPYNNRAGGWFSLLQNDTIQDWNSLKWEKRMRQKQGRKRRHSSKITSLVKYQWFSLWSVTPLPANVPVLAKPGSKWCCARTTDRASLQNATIKCN